MELKIRDNRKKEWFWLDNEYLNGYARYLGTSCTVVYLSLCRHANNETQSCFPSMELIGKENGIHRSTVIRAIKKLEEWKIIYVERGKNESGKQENNIYYLTEKDCWKAKPSSTKEHGSRVALNTKPSSIKCENRVAQSDTNNTNINNTNITTLCEDKPRKDIQELLRLFYENLNPNLKFQNKTLRADAEFLVSHYPLDKLETMILYIKEHQNEQYFPTITTPTQLRDKMASIINHKNREVKGSKIIKI